MESKGDGESNCCCQYVFDDDGLDDAISGGATTEPSTERHSVETRSLRRNEEYMAPNTRDTSAGHEDIKSLDDEKYEEDETITPKTQSLCMQTSLPSSSMPMTSHAITGIECDNRRMVQHENEYNKESRKNPRNFDDVVELISFRTSQRLKDYRIFEMPKAVIFDVLSEAVESSVTMPLLSNGTITTTGSNNSGNTDSKQNRGNILRITNVEQFDCNQGDGLRGQLVMEDNYSSDTTSPSERSSIEEPLSSLTESGTSRRRGKKSLAQASASQVLESADGNSMLQRRNETKNAGRAVLHGTSGRSCNLTQEDINLMVEVCVRTILETQRLREAGGGTVTGESAGQQRDGVLHVNDRSTPSTMTPESAYLNIEELEPISIVVLEMMHMLEERHQVILQRIEEEKGNISLLVVEEESEQNHCRERHGSIVNSSDEKHLNQFEGATDDVEQPSVHNDNYDDGFEWILTTLHVTEEENSEERHKPVMEALAEYLSSTLRILLVTICAPLVYIWLLIVVTYSVLKAEICKFRRRFNSGDFHGAFISTLLKIVPIVVVNQIVLILVLAKEYVSFILGELLRFRGCSVRKLIGWVRKTSRNLYHLQSISDDSGGGRSNSDDSSKCSITSISSVEHNT